MTRSAPIDLDGFDPDILGAARDVARRAGVPVETWIASIVTPDPVADASSDAAKASRSAPVKRTGPMSAAVARKPKPTPISDAAAVAPEAVHDAPQASKVVPEAPDVAPSIAIEQALARPETMPDTTTLAIAQLMERLDAMDRRIAKDHLASQDKANQTLENLERRITEVSGQIAAVRPAGLRNRGVREAVNEIRQRQRELDAGPTVPAAVIGELRHETGRLRAALDGVATDREVGILEQATRALAVGIERAPPPAILSAMQAPLEQIRTAVERLGGETLRETQARLTADLEQLGARVDAVIGSGPEAFADREALEGLFRDLQEIRAAIAGLAKPERIETLAANVAAIGAEIVRLQNTLAQEAGAAASRSPSDEIRPGAHASEQGDLEARIDAMAAKLDALRDGPVLAVQPDSDAIIDRIDALSAKVDAVHINPVGDLIERIEGLGASLRRPDAPDTDLTAIRAMLHDLSVKVDRMGTSDSVSAEGLDSLEQQVLALAARIDTRAIDPALAGLERTMGDLIVQVSALRDEAPVTERMVVTGTIEPAADNAELSRLQAGLADLRDQHAASEQRLQTTLNGVHTALERLANQFAKPDTAPVAPETRAATEYLLGKTATPPAQMAAKPAAPVAAPAMRPTARPAVRSVTDDILGDLPLEPGARRPVREAERTEFAATAPQDGDIKTSFIAAARRAAQVAQAEAAGNGSGVRTRASADTDVRGDAPSTALGLIDRLRGEIDRRRKPLLLGLAAIILALGALQAIKSRNTAPETVADVHRLDQPASTGTAATEPTTTQSLASTPPVKTEAAKPETTAATTAPKAEPSKSEPGKATDEKTSATRVPQVPAVASLSADLAAVPANLDGLRQAVIAGDGAAVYDLATRFFDGRGVGRDIVLSQKLYEALAQAGYAPAQYKLGGLHEKGIGVARDLNLAKTWYGRAAEQGNVRAMHNLAVIQAEASTASAKPNYAAAAHWFRQAAEHGLRDSQYNLAVLYARGLGMPQDLVQSYLWFSVAAAHGDVDSAKKRDDVAAKLDPKDLATARALVAAFKVKPVDAAVNEPPAASAAPTMSLLGAVPPTPVTTSPRRG